MKLTAEQRKHISNIEIWNDQEVYMNLYSGSQTIVIDKVKDDSAAEIKRIRTKAKRLATVYNTDLTEYYGD